MSDTYIQFSDCKGEPTVRVTGSTVVIDDVVMSVLMFFQSSPVSSFLTFEPEDFANFVSMVQAFNIQGKKELDMLGSDCIINMERVYEGDDTLGAPIYEVALPNQPSGVNT